MAEVTTINSVWFFLHSIVAKIKVSAIIKRSYLFIETMNKKIPVLNHSQSFHKQPVKIHSPIVPATINMLSQKDHIYLLKS